MRKTVIVVATAVLAVGSTSLSTSASAFGLLPLGGLGLVHPGLGLAQPGFRLARPGFGPAHIGGGYGLGHLDGSISGRRFGGGPSYGGYTYGGQPYYGDDANADESYDDSNYTDASARGRRSRRGAASR
jgi:hypothetical protein